MEKKYEVWIEIEANKAWITDAAKFEAVMKKCRALGMTGIILSVKDTTGFAIYPSAIAPHYAAYDKAFLPETDYVQQCFSIIKKLGMRCYAAFDAFAGGNKRTPHPLMPGIKNEGFACEVYGVDDAGDSVIKNSLDAADLHTVGSIDDFGEIFLNPADNAVQTYVLDLLREFVGTYHPDGIVLDRARYVGLSTDFSAESKKQWEQYSGVTGERWPQDIYQIVQTKGGYREEPGMYYGSFLTWRMQVIHDFVEKVSQLLRETGTEFCDYTGSWYPLYDQVGANWADSSYEGETFAWCEKGALKQTAYADLTDTLLSGCYYEEVTVQEAREKQKPADWYSVEGAADLARQVAGEKTTIVDSLFLDQYRAMPQKIPQAIALCKKKSAGCMLFDLSYLVGDDWWDYARSIEVTALQPSDEEEVAALCADLFSPEYFVTKQRLKENLWEDAEFDPSTSSSIRDVQNHTLLGFCGVKCSRNQTLYPDTAWISICGVAKPFQNFGYGTLLLQETLDKLRKKGVKTVFLGQDFSNFFSGIPAPDAKKMDFFAHLGFTLNGDEHYDLEGSVVDNKKIEQFDLTPWKEIGFTASYQGEREAFLSFLEREFPGRWVYEAQMALDEKKDPREIVLLWSPDHQEVLGFCMLTVEKNARGGLGPIGIAKKIRGNHVGDYMLRQSLVQLNRLGVVTVNIDWTILKEFYGQFDFSPARTYRAGWIQL